MFHFVVRRAVFFFPENNFSSQENKFSSREKKSPRLGNKITRRGDFSCVTLHFYVLYH